MNGSVIFFNHTYGFIRSPKVKYDIYFYYKEIVSTFYKTLVPGDFVEFELESTEDDKYIAHHIKQIWELEDGRRIIRTKCFKLENNTFNILDFYNQVVTKINSGLRYAKIFNGYIVASSEELDEATILVILEKQKDKHILFDDYLIKIIN